MPGLKHITISNLREDEALSHVYGSRTNRIGKGNRSLTAYQKRLISEGYNLMSLVPDSVLMAILKFDSARCLIHRHDLLSSHRHLP